MLFLPQRSVNCSAHSLWFQNRKIARFLCQLIPAQCPFERDLVLFNRTIAHIPPLCKLNPFHESIMLLRFKALSFLADECGEDSAIYC
jgi:hypothetical protein